ncbi:MAG: tetratricopeptide repeat protein [Chloroflexota bacterium]
MGLFDLLSLLYAFLGVRAIWTLAKNWRAFADDELTAFDRRLASEIAFFVFIPIGVFLHELGHAIATLQVGGQVVEFHYAFFYGYVVPRGNFTLLQDWWISLAGNLVSVIFGFVPLALLPLTRKVWIKYTMLALARIQLGWALVGYPLLTLAGFHGDWLTIYGTSWLLTIPLGVAHTALVLALWLIDRSAFVKRWEVSLFAGAAEPLRQLDAAIAARPGTVDPVIARGNFFASQNQFDLALADYRAALKSDPQNSRALYNIGQIRLIQKRYTDGEKHFRAALARVGDPKLAARAHFGLGLCLYHHSGAKQALPEFDAAILRDATAPEFFFWRGTARRALGDEVNAQNDFARAEQLAEK